MLKLEAEHPDLLAPILSLKKAKPKTYWFIVSWLGTHYDTPDWTNYGSDTWQKQAKIKGIDCSGLARVMHDKVFGYEIEGPSRMLLNKFSERIKRSTAKMGDLVFFKRYQSKDPKITHIGVYLMDNYFVHATSTTSAAKGLGLNVSSLEDKRWNDDLVAVGRVKDEFLKEEM
jgi:lipoprotein Spr